MLFNLNKKEVATNLTQIVNRSIIKRKSVKEVAISINNTKNIKLIIANIKGKVNDNLLPYKKDCILIEDRQSLSNYIEEANKVGYLAIDTETTGLDIFKLEIVGISLYTQGQKAAYIPINHINYNSFQKYPNQLNKEEILEELNNIQAKIIYHNGKFDLAVLKKTIGYDSGIYWDTFILEKLLTNGSNLSAGLKPSYSRMKKLEEEALSFDSYFKGITFNLVPIEVGFIYAAMDAKFTYELFLYQKQLIENNKEDYKYLYNLFRNIEMPLLRVVLSMEARGINFDFDYCQQLIKEYNEKLKNIELELGETLKEYERDIYNYRRINITNCKLSNPINYSSPLQIAIILYDIIGLSNKGSSRKTGEEELKEINIPFTNKLLEYREVKKLLTTYIEKMPEIVAADKKVHTSFNQVGTLTGRFSSENPNLQNIPTKGNIRALFTASEGKVLISCDYASQEPRIASHLSQDNVMINAFKQGKDFYAFLASHAYKIPYEKCLESYKEFDKNGKLVFEGKPIRKRAKNDFLGICYGMGYNRLAMNMGITVEEAIESIEAVFEACPGLLKLKQSAIAFGKKYGYIETYFGRRRILNHINKPRYEINITDKASIPFDPLSFNDNSLIIENMKKGWLYKLERARGYKAMNYIKEQGKKEGIDIIDNSGYIAEDERYCINTMIQGTAADMMKIALNTIYRDERLIKLDFNLLLTVHDEIIGECPIENVEEVKIRLKEDMLKPAESFDVPFNCDFAVYRSWDKDEIK